MVAFNRFAFGAVCVALALSSCAALLPLDVCKERAASGDVEAKYMQDILRAAQKGYKDAEKDYREWEQERKEKNHE